MFQFTRLLFVSFLCCISATVFSQFSTKVITFNDSAFYDGRTILERDAKFADIDGDGFDDLIVCYFARSRQSSIIEGDSIFWFKNDGQNNFSNKQLIYGTQTSDVHEFKLFDMDNDKDLDIVIITSEYIDYIFWQKNLNSGTFSSKIPIETTFKGQNVIDFEISNYRSYTKPDIYAYGSSFALYYKNDSASHKWSFDTIASNQYGGGGNNTPFVLSGGNLYTFLNKGVQYYLEQYSNFQYPPSPPYITKIDSLNSAYAAELFWINFDQANGNDFIVYLSGTAVVFLSNGNGYDAPMYLSIAGGTDRIVDFIDINGDSYADAVLANSNSLYYKLNDRNNGFGSSTTIINNYQSFELNGKWKDRFLDFDKDGDLDFYVQRNDSIIIYENYVNSPFQSTGVVFYDKNRNKTKDANEVYIGGVGVLGSLFGMIDYTDKDGKFQINQSPYYNAKISLDSIDQWELTTDSAEYHVQLTNANTTRQGLDFGIAPIDTIGNYNASLVGGFPRCGRTINYFIEVSNVGGSVLNGVIELDLEQNITFNSADLSPDSMVNNKIYWHFDSLDYFQKLRINCDVTMPNFNSLGDSLQSRLIISSGANTRIDSLVQVLRCSYDPNDKTVFPLGAGVEKYIEKDERLEYLIRFQNTGNDTAYNVVIKDRLSNNLDASTFELISSSHPVEIDYEKNKSLSFNFNDIYLVDSTTNEKLSHGFVKFAIHPTNNLSPNSLISNTASIYFDDNPSIVTNTVEQRIECYDTSKVSFLLFPSHLKVSATGYSNKFQWYYNNNILINSESDTVVFRGDGVYKCIVTSRYGCQSVSELYLDVDNVINNCGDYFWSQNGSTYNSPGVYFDTITTNPHRDSITVLNLAINNNTSAAFSSTSCGAYTWQGMSLTQSGTYHDTIQNSGGCDSLMTLNLTLSNSTSSSLSATSCVAYAWQGMNLTQSGTYHDTIQNSGGCDSLMTLNLTLSNSTSSSLSATSCGVYTWQGMNLTQSGTYHDTIQNSGGCDSLMTLNLTLGNPTSSSLSATSCGVYAWQGMSLTQSGTYHDTIQNSGGCDSLMTLNLTLGNSTSSSLSATSCGAYAWQGMSLTQSGTYHDTIPNSGGCDSLMTLNLIVGNSTSSSLSATSCGAYAWQGMSLTQSGTYHDTIPNSGGCDSLMTLNLAIDTNTSSVTSVSSCGTFNWRGNNYSQTGIYYDTIPNTNGCDSLMTFKLFLLNSDKSVAINNDTLLSNQTLGRYQWLDCSANFAHLLNDTNQYFVPSRNGSYAVEINNGNCTDTSSCILVTTVGVANPKIELSEVSLFPNPSNGQLNINFNGIGFSGSVELKDLNGRLLMVKDISSTSIYSFELNQPPGVYLITLKTINETKSYKVLLR